VCGITVLPVITIWYCATMCVRRGQGGTSAVIQFTEGTINAVDEVLIDIRKSADALPMNYKQNRNSDDIKFGIKHMTKEHLPGVFDQVVGFCINKFDKILSNSSQYISALCL
jgi:hypothetical protein